MKVNYELPASRQLVRRMPVIVRVDGRAFHTYTRGMDRPFDGKFMRAMVIAAAAVAEDMQGFKAAYIQSDEASFFATDYDDLQTESWFGYDQSKVETISASMMTAHFNWAMNIDRVALFDARAFNIPREEVSNYFLWRGLDWERNSLSMYCRSFFSNKEMQGRKNSEQHEMLHGVGRNWTTDLDDRTRNGTWLFGDVSVDVALRERSDVLPNYKEISALLDPVINCDSQRPLIPPRGE